MLTLQKHKECLGTSEEGVMLLGWRTREHLIEAAFKTGAKKCVEFGS